MAKLDTDQRRQFRNADSSSDLLYATCVFLIFTLAFLIRVITIPHQEPIIFHVDEPTFVGRAVEIARGHDLNPHWFGHPGSFTIYGLAALYRVAAELGDVPLKQLTHLYHSDPTPFHILGKYFIVFWSMLTLFGVWLLARQFVPRWAALLTPLILCCAPLDIELATTIRTDTQQAAILVLLCLVLIRGMRTPSSKAFIFAGLLLGVATSVKWPSVVACVPISVAAWLTHAGPSLRPTWAPTIRDVALAALASVVGLFLTAPYVFLDFGTVLQNMALEAEAEHLSATSPGFISTLGYYLAAMWRNGTWLGSLLAVVGVTASLRGGHRREHAVVLTLAAVYLVFISALSLRWPRWTVPLLPFIPLYAAVGSAWVYSFVLRQPLHRLASRGALALAGLVLALACYANAAQNAPRITANPAVAATDWITRNIPPGSRILTEGYATYLPARVFEIYESSGKGELVQRQQVTRYYAPQGRLARLKDVPSALAKVDFIMLGGSGERYRREAARYPREVAVYEELLRHSKPMKAPRGCNIRRVVHPER